MDPFRYSFETDEQYQARIEQLQTETQAASPPKSTALNRWFGLTLPWWVVGIMVVLILFLIYQESQKKLRRKLQNQARQQSRFPNQPL